MNAGAGITIQAEPFSSWYPEGHELFEAHWREVEPEAGMAGTDVCTLAYAPNWDGMLALERAGVWRTWTARLHAADASKGPVVGYVGALFAPHLHARGHRCGMIDAIYLLPAHRLGWTGSLLIAQAEEDLFREGAARVLIEVPVDHDFSPLLAKRGFQRKTVAWVKERPAHSVRGLTPLVKAA